MKSGFRRYPLFAALSGLGLVVWISSAEAQTLSARDASGSAGQVAAVPIVIDTGAANVAFFGATFTVAPQGGAPAIVDKLAYQAAAGVAPPDLQTAVAANAKLAIGYGGVTIDPPLKGKVQIGTLVVPIPAGATGSYKVQLSRISAGDASHNRVTLSGQTGTITVGGRRRLQRHSKGTGDTMRKESERPRSR
jgi:hypothetical protein